MFLMFAWFGAVMFLMLLPTVFTVIALVEASRAPEPAFGPPWDNCKNVWMLGLGLAFVIPFGTIVAPIVWWTNARPALRIGTQVPRPFWSPRPGYVPPPYGYQQPLPPYPPQPPAGT